MKRLYISKLLVLIALFSGSVWSTKAQTTTTFSFTTGTVQNYTVPAGCVGLQLDVVGGKGGGSNYGNGGAAGRVQVTMNVTPGQVYQMYVGSTGAGVGNNTGTAGMNGSGHVGGNGTSQGGAGGGSSEVWFGGSPIIVAGAGGGGSWDCTSDHGGLGGNTVAGNGLVCGSYNATSCGTGGNTLTSTGGVCGTNGGGATNGSLGNGGNANTSGTLWASGGGAGYYGGGGGSYYGSGGGGSSYPIGTGGNITGINHTQGYNNTGNGYILLTPLVPIVTASPTPLAFGSVLVGSTSVPPLFTSLSGLYMGTGPLTISVPAGSGFSVSTDGTTWGNTASLTYSGATFSGLNVYVSFSPTAATVYGANMSITGGGLGSAVNVPLSGTGVNLCTGAPSSSVAVATPTSGNLYTPFTLSLTPAPSTGGFTYQWQSSTTGSAPWNNVSGAVLSTYTFSGLTASTWYRCNVTCTGSGLTTTSSAVQVTLAGLAPAACTGLTEGSTWCCNFSIGYPTNTFVVPSASGFGALTDGFLNSSPTVRYNDFSSTLSCTEAAGTTVTTNINGASQSNITSCQMWVDFNNNGTFETSESVGGSASMPASTVSHPTITIPSTVSPGVYRFRVVEDFVTTGQPVYPSIPPCPTSAISYFDTRDYTMVIVPPNCSGTPNAGIVAATALSSCAPPFSFTPTLLNVGMSTASGVTYSWQTATSPGGPWSNIGGATNTNYTPTITALGVTYYRNSATCAFGSTGYSSVVSVSLNPTPSPISGSANLCTGVPSTLISTPSGGVWSSSNSAIASAASTSGAVTGVTVGNTTITYTLPTGCYATLPVTVNTQPAPIGGPSAVCQGSTVTLTDATTGGSWTSSTSSVASINPSTGVLTAASPGTTNITYASVFGCTTSTPITVNSLPPLFIVGGGGPYCVGSSSPWSVSLSGSTVGVTYQLLLGGSSTGLPALSGTGGGLNFGIQSAPGVYTVVATNNTTGCSRNMVGSATITVNPLPLQYSVSGGGSYCAGDLANAPHILLSGSQSGVNYYLYKNGVNTGVFLGGSGSALDFGPTPAEGIYTIVAINAGTGCTVTMLGNTTIATNPLPTAYNILPPGGASYCLGGAGVDIQLDFSNTGISYELFRGITHVATLSGTGGLLDFGTQGTAGTYTIQATNATTACKAFMSGAATITVNNLPAQHTVSVIGGSSTGSFCEGGSGVELVLDMSDGGVNYQLYNGTTPVGTAIGGTGLQISFGLITTPGTYRVVATDATTLCTNNMLSSATITINPLPTLGTVTGGGNFCVGGPGVHVGLNPTQAGISYQLWKDGVTMIGSPITGTGGAIDFGIFNTTGVYTVVATNNVTGCTRQMAGAATISTNPLPYAFNVTGSGAYCAGSTGLAVGLDFTATGITYQLYRSPSTAVGVPVTGTGAPISFGLQTIAGTYYVVGTNVSTSCVATMAGNAIVSINPLPLSHLVTGGGNFCAGEPGRNVGTNGSEVGNSYQLFLGFTPIGSPLPGTGSILDFGLQTLGGTYTVIATNNTTGCSRNMVGGAPINVNPLPTPYLVTGGGLYCAGTSGVHIGLSNSTLGVKYQLMNGSATVGVPVAGTGGAIDFGLHVNTGTYSVVGTNVATACTNNMTGSVTVAASPLPAVYTVTGGGNYCLGGTGVSVELDGSEVAVDYQLYKAGSAIGTAQHGTGSSISFGLMADAGNYTVVATNTITGCVKPMASGATVGINPLPASFTVTGGGNYCSGGAGYHIYLAGSSAGVNYTLMNGTTTVGSAITGTGSGVDFGAQTAAGSYTIVANDPATGCNNNMAGSATINIYALPATHNVTGGGGYCTGGTGINIGLDGSNYGVLYQLFQGATPVGVAVPGTGSNINFGLQSTVGNYTVVARNSATSCISNMSGSATVSVLPLPAAYGVTGGGTYCETGLGVHVNLSNSDLNVNYQLWNGSLAVGTPVPGTAGSLDFGLVTAPGTYTVKAVNATTSCASNMSGSAVVNVLPVLLPHANITASVSGIVCVGQLVDFTASPVNGGTAPTFQWFVNNVNVGFGTGYSYIPVDGDVVTARIRSNYQCAIPDTGSGSMVMTVSAPQMPSVTVSVDPGTQICTGGTATFTATTLYGGTAPTLRWIKNSSFVGTGTTYSYVPHNGDIVTFMLGSTFPCRLADTVFADNTTLSVEPAAVPVVSIATNPGTSVTAGQNVTFTATVVNGGSHPTFQWVVNSTPVAGATASTFSTSNLSNHDSVSCIVESACGLTGFNSVGMNVRSIGVGVNNVNGANSDLSLVPNPNKGDFTVKGNLSVAADQEVTLEVTNVIGQVVYTNKVVAHGGNINEHIKLSNLTNGMYLMSVRSGDDKSVFHFVIEQ